ncbi:MAG: hypothetical protein ACE5J3_08835 [Methanosarcinales archaeon]
MIDKEELKRRIREVKLPYREDVIREEDGKIIVDWKKIAEMEKTVREGTYSVTLLYGTYDHLIDLGILSLKHEGNYQLNTGGIFLNPRSHGLLPVYFTRKEDAEAYKKVMFGGALYPVDIFKLS